MIYVALGIVIAPFALIIKNFETRMVLAGSGILMAILGGDIGYTVAQFVKAMTGGVVPTICTVLGFSYVMQYTKCSDHLVVFQTNCLKKLSFIIIPATVIVTWFLSVYVKSVFRNILNFVVGRASPLRLRRIYPSFFHERNGAPARGAPCIENMH